MIKPAPERHASSVSILATGACTAVGYSAPTSAASVAARIDRMAHHPFMVDSQGKAVITARAQYLPDDMEGLERLWELGLWAALEALEALKESSCSKLKCPVIIGLPAVRPGFSKSMAKEIAARFKHFSRRFFEPEEVETICKGRSAGQMAIEKGCDIISKGIAPLCLAGGIDSWINQEDLEWLDKQEMLHTDANPWGLIPGEGAGFCLLASEKITASLYSPAVAHILAGATTLEKNSIKTGTVCTGQGLSQAIFLVIQGWHPSEDGRIDQIICDLNGLRYKVDEFGFSIVKNANRFKAPDDFMAPADHWGDTGAASGPLFISLAVHNTLQGHQKGPVHLVLTGSDTGERSATLIKTLNQQRKTEQPWP